LIAGLVVSGFGLASVYAAPLTKWLIATTSVPSTLLYLGVTFLIVVVILAQILTPPPKGYVPAGTIQSTVAAAPKKESFSPWEMLKTWQFYVLWLMYVAGAGAGLMVIAKLDPLAKSQAGLDLGFILVAALAVGNGAGRVAAGTLSDKLGRQQTMFICFLSQAVLMVVLSLAKQGSPLANVPVMALISALIGGNYGANLALFPSITKDYYGLENFGVNYGLVFTAWGVGGFVLSLLAGKLFDWYQTYALSCYVATALLLLAACATFAVKPPQVHREVA